MLFRFFSYFSGMNIDSDIFKIQSNNVLPSRGRILISEPFLRDATFGRSVILLVDHTDEGSMGLVINKQLPLFLNDIIMEFKYLDEIPHTKVDLLPLIPYFISTHYLISPDPFLSVKGFI